EFPVKPGVARSELVSSWGEFPPDTLPLTDVSGHRAEALKIMEEVNFDG
ncbi:MAG TPA: iron ABC transporter substrate-binding protein, partial [Gemmobacter sp.]|nr:iron ABC transporter substrate-binding protein [Gemmobacter sp.]